MTASDVRTPQLIALISQAIDRIRRNDALFGRSFPSYGDGDAVYLLTPNQNWLAAFWAGLLWLAAASSGDEDDLARARARLPSFVERLDQRVRLNHDLGFLFTLSARAQWQITGDEQARSVALRAASALLERYRSRGQYIQAWAEVGDAEEGGRLIIDCMMNLPLLYWAATETGQAHYADAATAHAHTSMRCLLRSDGSTYHTFFFDQTTGEPRGPKTHQGYADDSIWSRGQAWAIYGFALSCAWTQDSDLLRAAQQTADRYLLEAPAAHIAPWDFRLNDDSTPAYPDSSADAIAVCGLLRLADLTGSAHYRAAAEARLHMLIDRAFDHRLHAQGLLLHGTQHAPHGYGINTYTIFGDYFFLEAVLTVMGGAPDFWGPMRE